MNIEERKERVSSEDHFQAGIEAAQAGDLARAAASFARFVKENPNSEQGWLWLGLCCPEASRREFCFRRVLALNPDNLEARQQLEILSIALPTPSAAAPQLPTSEKLPPEERPAPEKPSPISPFVYTQEVAEVAEELHAPPASPVSDELPKPLAAKTPAPTAGKIRKGRPALVWILLVLLLCALGIGFLYFSGRLSSLLPMNAAPTQASAFTLGPQFTLTPSPTPIPPAATFSPTPAPPTAIPSPRPTVSYIPIFETAKCEFDTPQGAYVTCGTVTLPEDRTGEHKGEVQLSVAIFHSKNPKPAADPVVFLQGGPGGQAVMLSAGAYGYLVEPFLSKRDFITFDQRGTGLSKPALGCEELETVYKQDIHGQIPASSRDMIYTNAFRSCHGSMSVGGIDLNSYTTAASANDLMDIISVLGYKKVNLYGASYGTRLALVTMRTYPGIVRSAVLDSVVPVEAKLFDTDPLRYDSSLQAMFNGCAADPSCNAAYPNLKTVFWDLVDQLDANPVSVTAPLLTGGTITELLDGSDLMGVTLALLKTTDLILTVPESIYRIQAGDYSTFVAMQSSLPYEFEGINIGLYISMMCHEQILATTPQDLQAAMDSQHDIGRYSRLPFFGDAQDMFNTCKVWGSVPPSAGENDPVVSDIPTLIIEGEYDPSTPPLFGQQVSANLKNKFYMEFPNQGHTPTGTDTSGCAFGTMLSFIDDPVRGPDRACLAKIGGVKFLVPYTGDPSIELKDQQGLGFSSKVPADWVDYGLGIFLRKNSPLDITQVAILWTDYNSTELLDWLSSKLYGYQGFDAAPIQTGTRQANGLSWSLYQTTSYGRPVELAMADHHNGGALVVLLFCHKDERDALYQTVYLPIIDSMISIP